MALSFFLSLFSVFCFFFLRRNRSKRPKHFFFFLIKPSKRHVGWVCCDHRPFCAGPCTSPLFCLSTFIRHSPGCISGEFECVWNHEYLHGAVTEYNIVSFCFLRSLLLLYKYAARSGKALPAVEGCAKPGSADLLICLGLHLVLLDGKYRTY